MKDESLQVAFEVVDPELTQQSSAMKIDAEMNTVDQLLYEEQMNAT